MKINDLILAGLNKLGNLSLPYDVLKGISYKKQQHTRVMLQLSTDYNVLHKV